MDPNVVNEALPAAVGAGIGIWTVIIGLAAYVFFAYCLALIAKKIGRPFQESFIMALIPIANIILILQMACKPWWWIFLTLIPIVNIVIWFIVWMKICECRGRPAWWGVVMMLVPIVNLILFFVLAFGNGEKKEGCCCSHC